MKPLLAHVYEPHRVTYPCYVQPKLNGIRALYQNGRFQSRDQHPFPEGLLAHIAEPLRALPPHVILDGELYVHGWPLQRINGAVTPVRQVANEDTVQVEYHVFDRVDYDKTFHQRQPYTLGYAPWPVCVVETKYVRSEGEANDHYARFVANGYEGMMYRLGDCPYTTPKARTCNRLYVPPTRSPFLSDKNNRCWHLLKRKDWQDDEFVCVDVVEGEGKRQGMVGSFTCTTHQEGLAGQFSVGSFNGFTDADLIHYLVNPPIGRKLKIKYLCFSSSGKPLNPTLLAVL